MRAAPGRVRHHDVDAGERAQVAFGEGARGVEPSVVGGQGPAARLCTGNDNAPPVPRQHTDRREVHLAEPTILHAAAQQCDGPSLMAGGRRLAGEAAEQRRTLRGDRADAFRECEACERLHRRGEPQQLLPRERYVEPEPPEEPRSPRPERLHLDARALHHPSERDVRGTDVLAGSAREAEIHEARERLVGFGEALGHRTHRRDPATRRRRLFPGHAVGGAVRQAQPARHAGCQVRVGRRVERESPPRSEVGRRSDEPHPVGHLAAERNAAVRMVALGAHVTDASPRATNAREAPGRVLARPDDAVLQGHPRQVHAVTDPVRTRGRSRARWAAASACAS